jgi:hypothetical protein
MDKDMYYYLKYNLMDVKVDKEVLFIHKLMEMAK